MRHWWNEEPTLWWMREEFETPQTLQKRYVFPTRITHLANKTRDAIYTCQIHPPGKGQLEWQRWQGPG